FSDTVLRSLLRELGLESEMRWTKTRTAFYTDSKLHSMSNVAEYLRFPLLGWIDKVRLGATILHASRIKDSKSLENIRVEDWLRQWSGDRVTDELWIPLLRSKLGDSYRDTSAAFIWSTVARMYAARRTRSKTELFGYVPGGYARVIQRFAEILDQAGVNCRNG